jgi:hypothetical protein
MAVRVTVPALGLIGIVVIVWVSVRMLHKIGSLARRMVARVN